MSNYHRDALISKINMYKMVIASTKSEYLKRDYQKALKKLQKELRTYDKLQESNK